MTIKELIKELEKIEDKEKEIFVDLGDYEERDCLEIKEREYSVSMFISDF